MLRDECPIFTFLLALVVSLPLEKKCPVLLLNAALCAPVSCLPCLSVVWCWAGSAEGLSELFYQKQLPAASHLHLTWKNKHSHLFLCLVS